MTFTQLDRPVLPLVQTMRAASPETVLLEAEFSVKNHPYPFGGISRVLGL